MATQGMVSLQTITLTGSASSIVFGSIPQNYRDLLIITQPKSTSSVVDQAIRFNGNSTIPVVVMWGYAGSYGATTSNALLDYYGSVTTDNTNATVIQVFDYSASDKYKSYLSRANRAAHGVDLIAGRWSSNAPITSVTHLLNGSSFAAGTTISLYGIAG